MQVKLSWFQRMVLWVSTIAWSTADFTLALGKQDLGFLRFGGHRHLRQRVLESFRLKNTIRIMDSACYGPRVEPEDPLDLYFQRTQDDQTAVCKKMPGRRFKKVCWRLQSGNTDFQDSIFHCCCQLARISIIGKGYGTGNRTATGRP